MVITLPDIFVLDDPADYKVHFSRWNGSREPLDVWVDNPEDFRAWQEYRPKRNEFNRPYIFSLARFYHQVDTWLFTGVYEIVERLPDRYVVRLTNKGESFIGRLKIGYTYRDRSVRLNFETHYGHMVVSEILPEPYSGRAFPGFDAIELGFSELESLARIGRADWRAALTSVKGIYLLSDTITGRGYVGAAYGEGGVWARWCAYGETGHGGNVDLVRLVGEKGLDHCRSAFRFSLLEHRPAATSDAVILDREAYWKRILMTRGAFGHNRN